MEFRADDYFHAGQERMSEALAIFNRGQSYALAMYCAGLAVECLLRAFRWDKHRSFEGRHDLGDLLKASDLLVIDEDYMRRQGVREDDIDSLAIGLRAAISEVIALWHNNLRFASERRLRAWLNQLDRLQGIRGNARKKNAKDLLSAAQRVIERGVALWNSKKK